jgi:glucose/mannose transport system substrate-binding protein
VGIVNARRKNHWEEQRMKKYLLLVAVFALVGALSVTAQQTFSIYEYWTAGGEKQAIDAELKYFEQQYPNLKIVVNPVAGGDGANLSAVIKSLVLAGLPPTTFQIHAGWGMYEYASADVLEPINNLWDQHNWKNVFPQHVQELNMYKGSYYSVPIDVHRGNMIWYSKELFNKTGMSEPTSPAELFSTMAKFKQAGITPVALGDRYQWPSAMLFEELLLGTGGLQTYDNFFTGKVDYSQPQVMQTFKSWWDITNNYVNNNHASLTWDQAVDLVAKNQAAMTVMGDWAVGYFEAVHLKAGVDYGYAPVPGSKGIYNLVIDSFPIPKGVANRQASVDWLQTIGSVEGQIKFNIPKGSIPARTDVPTAGFNPVQVANIADLKVDKQTGSASNGMEVPASFQTAWLNALTVVQYHPNLALDRAISYLNDVNKQYLTPQNLAH